jgi:hypothetical protein
MLPKRDFHNWLSQARRSVVSIFADKAADETASICEQNKLLSILGFDPDF